MRTYNIITNTRGTFTISGCNLIDALRTSRINETIRTYNCRIKVIEEVKESVNEVFSLRTEAWQSIKSIFNL